MSKKHFIELANMIRWHNRQKDLPQFSPDHLATLQAFCHEQNPRFNTARWRAYIAGECGPNGGAIKSQPEAVTA